VNRTSDRRRDCGARPGEFHRPDCDVEQCPYCGGQLISCDCGRRRHLEGCLPWQGAWPGVAEPRELGWFARVAPGRGWVPCGPEEPRAAEGLNRLRAEVVWERDRKPFVLPRIGHPSVAEC
jgi:hypothetical protein